VAEYHCKSCDAEVKSRDTVCSNCGANLKEVGRNIVLTLADAIAVSDEVETGLTKEQISIIKKVYRAIKNELAKKEIESITFGFPQLVSIKIKNKKDVEAKD